LAIFDKAIGDQDIEVIRIAAVFSSFDFSRAVNPSETSHFQPQNQTSNVDILQFTVCMHCFFCYFKAEKPCLMMEFIRMSVWYAVIPNVF